MSGEVLAHFTGWAPADRVDAFLRELDQLGVAYVVKMDSHPDPRVVEQLPEHIQRAIEAQPCQ